MNGPTPNNTPRRETSLNRRQERFCFHFLATGDAEEAYRLAGYKTTGDRSARVCGLRLLKNAAVLRRINEEQIERLGRLKLDADKLVQHFWLNYLKAERIGDIGAANASLREVGKLMGEYERHNSQKSGASIEEIRLRLEAQGFYMGDGVNKPIELADLPPFDGANRLLPYPPNESEN